MDRFNTWIPFVSENAFSSSEVNPIGSLLDAFFSGITNLILGKNFLIVSIIVLNMIILGIIFVILYFNKKK